MCQINTLNCVLVSNAPFTEKADPAFSMQGPLSIICQAIAYLSTFLVVTLPLASVVRMMFTPSSILSTRRPSMV